MVMIKKVFLLGGFMLVLGLQGSPRKGNTYTLLSNFLNRCEELGAKVKMLEVSKMNISGCQECGNCERRGYCPINDDMQKVYPLLREADIVVLATPVFFYGPTAQLKLLIDRSQALWSRKYVYNLKDPGSKWRKGIVLSVGATKGKNLFDPIVLIAKYFFDAVGANFSEENSLFFRKIDKPKDILNHPTALEEVKELAQNIIYSLTKRKKVLFLCKENACRSQMAYGFARYMLGDRLDVMSAGTSPAKEINPLMMEVMAEKSIDMAYIKPKSLEDLLKFEKPHIIFTMGCEDECVNVPFKKIVLNFQDPSQGPIELMRRVRDEIEGFIKSFDFDTI